VINEFLDRHKLIRRALWTLVVFFCCYDFFVQLKAARQYQRIIRWPKTEEFVRSADIYETGFPWIARFSRFCPKLEYSYSVAGHIYISHNGVPDLSCWQVDQDARDFVAQHSSGGSIQLAYDPVDPSVTFIPAALRDPGYPWFDAIVGTFFIALILDFQLAGRDH
jgi:hypothetical protein